MPSSRPSTHPNHCMPFSHVLRTFSPACLHKDASWWCLQPLRNLLETCIGRIGCPQQLKENLLWKKLWAQWGWTWTAVAPDLFKTLLQRAAPLSDQIRQHSEVSPNTLLNPTWRGLEKREFIIASWLSVCPTKKRWGIIKKKFPRLWTLVSYAEKGFCRSGQW